MIGSLLRAHGTRRHLSTKPTSNGLEDGKKSSAGRWILPASALRGDMADTCAGAAEGWHPYLPCFVLPTNWTRSFDSSYY